MAPRAVRREQFSPSLFQRAGFLALSELRHHAERNAGNAEFRVHGTGSVKAGGSCKSERRMHSQTMAFLGYDSPITASNRAAPCDLDWAEATCRIWRTRCARTWLDERMSRIPPSSQPITRIWR